MTYGELQTLFLSTLNRRDCTTAQAKAYLQQGLTEVNRKLRTPAQEKTLTYTVDENYDTYGGLPVPSDYLELISIIPMTQGGGENTSSLERLGKVDETRALRLAVNTGVPEAYCRDGNVWILGPKPVVGDAIRIKYYGESAALDQDSDTNVLTLMAWDLILYTALAPAADFFGHKKRDEWAAKADALLADLNDMADDDETSGAAQVQSAYMWPNEDCD